MSKKSRKPFLLFVTQICLLLALAAGGELPDLGEPIGEEEAPAREGKDYNEFPTTAQDEWQKGKDGELPFLEEDGFIGEFKAPDPGELLALIEKEEKELRVERGRAEAAQGEMQLPEELVSGSEDAYEVELVDNEGRVLRTYRYRRQQEAEMRDETEGWVLEVADARGVVTRSVPLREEDGRRVRWEFGEGELAVSASSYRLRGAADSVVSGSMLGLGQSKMFSLPDGKTVPALAGSSIDVHFAAREAIRRLELAIVEKGKGKAVRRFTWEGEIPASANWDGRDEKGKYVRTDRDYAVRATLVDRHGMRQVAEAEIARVALWVSRISEGMAELRGPCLSFSYNRATVGREEYARLNKVVEATKRPGVMLAVEGHTDCLGTDDYNNDLAKKRALVVMKHLVRKEKVPVEGLRLRAHGRRMPRCSNLDAAGRRKNRRVEFVLSLPLDKSGLDAKQARKMVRRGGRQASIKKGEKLAVMPFPAAKEARRMRHQLAYLFKGSGILLPVEGEVKDKECAALDCWAEAAAERKANWMLCASLSQESETRFLVVELINVKERRVLVSDSLPLKGDKQARIGLMRRLIKRVLAHSRET